MFVFIIHFTSVNIFSHLYLHSSFISFKIPRLFNVQSQNSEEYCRKCVVNWNSYFHIKITTGLTKGIHLTNKMQKDLSNPKFVSILNLITLFLISSFRICHVTNTRWVLHDSVITDVNEDISILTNEISAAFFPRCCLMKH